MNLGGTRFEPQMYQFLFTGRALWLRPLAKRENLLESYPLGEMRCPVLHESYMNIQTSSILSTLQRATLMIFLSLVISAPLLAQTDPLATPETKALYRFLKKSAKTGSVFGAQTTTSMGIGWTTDQASPLRSDVKTATGDYPALFGFDFKKWNFNLDKGWMTDLEQVKEIYKRGGIITFAWHTDNPFTGGNSKYKKPVNLDELLPNGKKNKLFTSWLDKIAEFAHAAEVDGVKIPILFRPLHENSGKWFWWGSQNSPESYIRLFRYVVDYLRNEKKVHSFLYVYSPSKIKTKEHYLKTYPGDDYVDVLAFDAYIKGGSQEVIDSYVDTVTQLAKEKGKVAAISEIGCRKGIANAKVDNWHSKHLLSDAVKNQPIAYYMVWHNHDKHYWIPPKGDKNYEDFIKFYKDESSLFLKDIQGKNVYHSN